MRIVAMCVVVVCALCESALAQSPQSASRIRQIIAQQQCSAAGLAPDVANAVAASYSVLREDKDCIIAFFRDLDRDGSPLEVISARAPSYGWSHVSIAVDDIDRSPVESITLEGELILINLHYTLDDYAIPILDARLRHIGTIHGTFTRMWPNGLLEYSPHQPHFGPQNVKIGIFDATSGADREIYPFQPCDPVRGNYVRRYYRVKNIPADRTDGEACWTESETLGSLYFDWRTNAFAFALELFFQYSGLETWDERVQIMVTCEGLATINSIKCHETPLEAWQSARPDLNLTQLIAFAASQPRFR